MSGSMPEAGCLVLASGASAGESVRRGLLPVGAGVGVGRARIKI